jgi:hypothetical protein
MLGCCGEPVPVQDRHLIEVIHQDPGREQTGQSATEDQGMPLG